MDINEFRKKRKHLPAFLKDFHDQKDFFKAMHDMYQNQSDDDIYSPKLSFAEGQIYVIDWFLWFCAMHGYGLKKISCKDVEFYDLFKTIKDCKKKRLEIISKIITDVK